MFFTREDILKIQQALLQLGVKDSELPSAEPVTYDDTLSIVQDGKNKQIGAKDFCNQISLWKREDFINITDKYDKHYISLIKAINLVPILQRKDGLVITFQDVEGNWEIYQFRGNITEFFEEDKWFNLYDYRNNIVQSIVPDEEDLTASTPDENGNSLVSLKDRVYDPTSFSGKGHKILRKNIQPTNIAVTKIKVEFSPSSDGTLSFSINGKETQVSVSISVDNTTTLVADKIASKLTKTMTEYEVLKDASTITLIRKFGGSVTPSLFSASTTGVVCTVTDSTKKELRNILTSAMINQPNTIYEVRYDFDLNGETIEMQEGCTLKFNGGSLSNGNVVGNNTIIESFPIQIFKNISILGTWNCVSYPEWFDNIQSIFDKSTFSNIKFVNTYRLKEPIIISRDNINIDGGGRFITESTNVFHILNCSNITISSLSFSALAASDSAIFCKVVNNLKINKCSCENINLFSSASGSNDNYNLVTKENSNNYIVISNNSGINTNPKITNQAIRLIFVNNFSVVGNNFDGYYNGILAWGGDAAHVCQTLSEDRKCKDGIIANNVFTNCLSAGIWTGCAQRVTLTNNLVTSNMNSSQEGLDAEGSIDILFEGNIVRGFSSACCMFGNVDNIIFKNNDIELNSDTGYVLQFESFGIADITKKNGVVKLEGNRIFSTSTKYFYYTGKALICINNTLYNPVDNSGLSGGYGYFCNNRVIYNVNWSQRNGMLRTMYLRPIDGVKENFYNVIGNEFISECDDIDDIDNGPMLLTAQNLENATLNISNNKFLNFQGCFRVFSDAVTKTYITFENNIFDSKVKYPIYSNTKLPNTLLLWNNNTFTTGEPIELKLLSNLNNLFVRKGSRIAYYQSIDGYPLSDVKIAMKDGELVNESIYNRNELQIIPKMVNNTSELPTSLIYAERGMTIFDSSTQQLLVWNGSSWRRDGGGSTDKPYGIDVNLQNEPIGSMFFRTDLHKPIFNDKERGYYVDSDGNKFNLPREGPSSNRPENVNFGFIYKDTTIGKLIIWDGTSWVNMDGTALS